MVVNSAVNLTVKDIVSKYKKDHSQLIQILSEIQEENGHLTKELLCELARELEMSLVEIQGVASFYNEFKTSSSKYLIKICNGTACHVAGNEELKDYLEAQIDILDNKSDFKLQVVNCLGVCSLAPAMVINGEVHSKMTKEKIKEVLQKLK